VLSNVQYPFLPEQLSRHDAHHVRELLDMLDLQAIPVDRKCEGLSGGEQQRVCLARCFFMVTHMECGAVLLDEPTSACSSSFQRYFFGLLAGHTDGRQLSAYQSMALSRFRKAAIICVAHHIDAMGRQQPKGWSEFLIEDGAYVVRTG
jgi:ABC-type hemin transport system ATPase subunit